MKTTLQKQANALWSYLRSAKSQKYRDGILERSLLQSKLESERWITHAKPGKFPHESTRKA